MSTEMIQGSTHFQTSINISYDLNNEEKITNFIPTDESIQLLESILLSTEDKEDVERERILIGAYGKGKSYMLLEILSILTSSAKDIDKYKTLLKKIKQEKEELYNYVLQYINSSKRLLPIIINGNNTSLTQSFLYALHSTLKQKEFEQLMPETHFEAAINMINLWQEKYPETYKIFNREASLHAEQFKEGLCNYNEELFEEFEELYPKLTSGSAFNPFAGFDVVDLYSEVAKKLSKYGYNGIYIVYDEFGKYLESSISKATVKDIKLLQDFAEKCNRSGKEQLHLMLICHKEIENYIDILPKQKVDGWKGVSERFLHVHMQNHYSEVYELIGSAIVKDEKRWVQFQRDHEDEFLDIEKKWSKQSVFSDIVRNKDQNRTIVRGCFPLHPITTFILPRLSEKVAQNERTLFTFLSSSGNNTLSSFTTKSEYVLNGKIKFISPDILYDYFERQMQSEPYTSEIRKWYSLSAQLLQTVEEHSLESKIVKTITLIYVLNQYERLQPTSDIIFAIYGDAGIPFSEIKAALVTLTQKTNIIYERTSGARYLQLKESSGCDVLKTISYMQEKRKTSISDCEILNSVNTEQYLYPVEYNTDFSMTRYFKFYFVDGDKLFKEFDWSTEIKRMTSDGVLFGIISSGKNENTIKKLQSLSREYTAALFVCLKKQEIIHKIVRQYDAVSVLRERAISDKVLFMEYDLMYDDLLETIRDFIHLYTQPERNLAIYISDGEIKHLYRKANLTSLLSDKCRTLYSQTPVINNEMLNKNNLTGAAYTSRLKLLNGILNSDVPNLGLTGNGQEVSFMRSTLLVPGILSVSGEKKYFNETPETDNKQNDRSFSRLFSKIEKFIEKSKKAPQKFNELYEQITGIDKQIGLRRGVVPVYFAVVISKYLRNASVKSSLGEIEISPELLSEMVDNPNDYTLSILDWTDEKEIYVQRLETLFSDFVIKTEKNQNGYVFLTNSFVRWYRSLPRYIKQIKKQYLGKNKFEDIPIEYLKFLDVLKQSFYGAQEILFVKIPIVFGYKEFSLSIFGEVKKAKNYFDSLKNQLETILVSETQKILVSSSEKNISLKATVCIFLQKLSSEAKTRVFDNGAQKLIPIFENVTNDDMSTLENIVTVVTGLSIDDWTDETVIVYSERLRELLTTLRSFVPNKHTSTDKKLLTNQKEYVIQFVGDNGKKYEKIFEQVECSKRAEILNHELGRTIEEMGQSVTEREKRQVLINLLEKLC